MHVTLSAALSLQSLNFRADIRKVTPQTNRGPPKERLSKEVDNHQTALYVVKKDLSKKAVKIGNSQYAAAGV